MLIRQLELVPRPADEQRDHPLAAFRMELEPQVAQRGRCGCVAGHGHMYDDKNYELWKKLAIPSVRDYWGARIPLQGLLVVQVLPVFARPQTEGRTFVVKGITHRHPWPWPDERFPYAGPEDLDNLRKAVLDVMVHAGVLLDDRLAVKDGGSEKLYAARGENACVDVRVWRR